RSTVYPTDLALSMLSFLPRLSFPPCATGEDGAVVARGCYRECCSGTLARRRERETPMAQPIDARLLSPKGCAKVPWIHAPRHRAPVLAICACGRKDVQ